MLKDLIENPQNQPSIDGSKLYGASNSTDNPCDAGEIDLKRLISRWNLCLQTLSKAVSMKSGQTLIDHPDDSYVEAIQNHSRHLASLRELTADLIDRSMLMTRGIRTPLFSVRSMIKPISCVL